LNPYTTARALNARSRLMMVWAVHIGPCPVGLVTSRTVGSIAMSYRVTSPTNRAYEWSVVRHCTVEPHCSGLSARLVSYDDVIHPHVLQAPR
jgi:hypothetical protein